MNVNVPPGPDGEAVGVAVGVAVALPLGVAVGVGVGAEDALWQAADPLSVNEPVAGWKLQS